MKAQPFVPNKKLILHFDVDGVLRLPVRKNKDLYVYELCSDWVWGKLEKTSKEDPDKVTGWKLASNSLLEQAPEPELISYKKYLQEYVKPEVEQWEKLMLNLSKGPAGKAKAQIEKTIKNITIPKALYETLKQSKQSSSRLEQIYISEGKYEILPAFYKLFLSLKKSKRQFAICIKTDVKNFNHNDIIEEINLFFTGEHPLYNGKNGTPLVKMDGTNKCKNFVFEDSHFGVIYQAGEGDDFMASFGTHSYVEEKDLEMLKQTLKSNKKIKVCENSGQIYSYFHSILAESACIYELNPSRAYFIDNADYLTQQIYFSSKDKVNLYSALGERIEKAESFYQKVNEFEMLRDVDYFIKKVEKKQEQRAVEIQKIQKGEDNRVEENGQANEENTEEVLGAKQAENNEPLQSNSEYLRRTIIPILDGALRQVDLFRPEDPIGFIALYCLKNRERIQ